MFKHIPLFVASILLLTVILILVPGNPLKYRNNNQVKYDSYNNLNQTTPIFKDYTIQSGIIAFHAQGGDHLNGLDEALGAGACAFDFNNDGWTDIFIVTGSGQNRYYGRHHWWQKSHYNRLFKNIGNNRFIDVSKESGLAQTFWGMGCAYADLNNDGYDDLLLTNKGENVLYKNNGDGSFSDITLNSGIEGNNWSTSASFGDYDNDGDLDIYIVNYIKFKKGKRTFESNQGFQQVLPSEFNSSLYDSESNILYQNEGEFKFIDITKQANVANKSGRGLAARWFDINSDMLPDLLISNDKGLPNVLFKNNGDGTFSEVSEQLNLNDTIATTAIAVSDINNDLLNDIVLGTVKGHANLIYLSSTNSVRSTKTASITYEDKARDVGIANSRYSYFSTFGVSIADFNNDGKQDLFSANGLTSPDPDNHQISLGQINELWLNTSIYTNIQYNKIKHGDALQDLTSNRTAVSADFDNDGDIDLFLTSNNDLGQLLINHSKPANWLKIRLQGSLSNKNAYGSKIYLTIDHKKIYKEAIHPAALLSNSSSLIHFGLNQAENIKQIEVRWPSGKTDYFKNIQPKQTIIISEDSGLSIAKIETGIKNSSKLELTPSSMPAKIAYYKLLIKNNLTEYLNLDYFSFTDNESTLEKLILIKTITKHPSPIGLQLLIILLNDASTEIKKAALEGLRIYESPESVRWLLHQFTNTHAEIKCKTANIFMHFFKEEEAVTKYKYLAVPHLIKLLNDTSESVQLCSIESLGESDNYRATEPLLKKLHSSNINIVNAAIRALGLIRQGLAIEPLLTLYNRDTTQAKTRAYILIALKRLNYEKLNLLLNELTNLSDDRHTKQRIKLLILQNLIEHKLDSTVFKPITISKPVTAWLSKIIQNNSLNNNSLRHAIISAIKIIAKIKNEKNIILIRKFTRHNDPLIRAQAYKALISIPNSNITDDVIRGLNDKDNIKTIILDTLADNNKKIDAEILIQRLNQPLFQTKLISMLEHYLNNEKVQNSLINFALNKQQPEESRIFALMALSKAQKHRLVISREQLPKNSNVIDNLLLRIKSNHIDTLRSTEPLKFLIIKFIDSFETSKIKIEIISENRYSWSTNYLKQIITGNSLPTKLKLFALEKLAQYNTQESTNAIFNIATKTNLPIKINAIKYLANFESPLINKWLIETASNIKENSDARIMSLYALMPNHSKTVLKLLKKQLNDIIEEKSYNTGT